MQNNSAVSTLQLLQARSASMHESDLSTTVFDIDNDLKIMALSKLLGFLCILNCFLTGDDYDESPGKVFDCS